MLVEMKNIVMEFGPTRAVNDVSITVDPGTILGLLGENGAGKSTLMNVLAGTYLPTKGGVFINGQKVVMASAKVANQHGIRFIHQELNLCNDLKVFENMYLGSEISRGGLLREEEMKRRCTEVLARMQVAINLDMLVCDLNAAQKQLVEIAKALLFKSELIIMDEPSTALSTHEIENLFDIMRSLKKEGVSFIYISHKMPELFEICDKYYVLRDGCLVAEGKFEDTDEDGITELMIGRQLHDAEFENHADHIRPEVAMEAQHLSGEGFEDISFQLHKGEVLAITGLQGSGRDELADALFGVIPARGRLSFGGQTLENARNIKFHMKHGVALVPRMRKERGIHDDLSIIDNMSMAFLNTKWKKLLISGRAERERFERQQKALQIKAGSPANPITSLSGGNQQKVILGKWLETDAEVLLFDNPTQGIDVGTKFEIYHLILELAKQGKAIIVFSSEFPEIYKVADSCMVLYKGRVNAVMSREEMTEKNVMYYSTGANVEGAKNA